MIEKSTVLFRGKRKETSEWVEGCLIFDYPENNKPLTPYIGFVEDDGVHIDEVIHETVSQYAGFSDKNGKRVYAGDVVQYHHEEKELVPVKDKAPYERSHGIDEDSGLPLVVRTGRVTTHEGIVTVDLLEGVRINLPRFCHGWQYDLVDNKCMSLEVIGNIYKRGIDEK